MHSFETIRHQVPVCVVGGGLAGLCAAVACARHGVRVLLMQDRPMLGGNASSEIRMWVCGAHGENHRETGLIEELLLDNQYYNPEKNYSLWDNVVYQLAFREENLELLLNCTCMSGEMSEGKLSSITGWQMSTQRFHTVTADLFIDCSGDSVLAPITGAEYHIGREGRSEYGESIAPIQADRKTMGSSILLQARKEASESIFTPPPFADTMTREDLAPYRLPNMDSPMENYWYLELGGEEDTIRDAESLRNRLLAKALGLWDYIKNAPENREKNRFWHLDWMGFLPGKRESRRYLGDYLMTQQDVESEGRFDDLVSYGGWTMDDHHPAGMNTHEEPTVFHPAPSPFGIPYRCLYSKNIPNLMFAGRNISVTHSAFSSVRVMATCAIIGQAAGSAAALCTQYHTFPREIGQSHLSELQELLQEDDCWLPFRKRRIPTLSQRASYTLEGQDASVLKNGWDRPQNGQDNGLLIPLEKAVEIRWQHEEKITSLRLIFDSDLNRETLPETRIGLYRPMLCNRSEDWKCSCVPKTLTKCFRVEALQGDTWNTVYEEKMCWQRLVQLPLSIQASALRIVPLETWGNKEAHWFSVDVK